ncbi:MAG: hypothetical protein ACYC5H_08265 [Methylovirgula sp.]
MNHPKLLILALAGGLLGAAPSMAMAEPMPKAATWHHHHVSHWHHRHVYHRHAYMHRRSGYHSYTAFSRRMNGVPCGVNCERSQGQ